MSFSEVLGEIFKFLNNIFITPKKQIQKVVKIYDAMHKILDETEIQRTLVFKIHNGGGLIKPGTDLFVSVLYEDYAVPFKTVKHEYQKLSVDKEYVKMLLDIIEKKKVVYNVDNVPSEFLKGIYLREGVKTSLIYFLGQDKKNVYFCSCASAWDASNILKPEQSVVIDLAINTMKQNIK